MRAVPLVLAQTINDVDFRLESLRPALFQTERKRSQRAPGLPQLEAGAAVDGFTLAHLHAARHKDGFRIADAEGLQRADLSKQIPFDLREIKLGIHVDHRGQMFRSE